MKGQIIKKTIQTLANPKFIKKAIADIVLPNVALAALMVVGAAFSSRNDYDEFQPVENPFENELPEDIEEDEEDTDFTVDSDDEA